MHSDIIVKGLRPYSTVFSSKSPESLLPNRRQLPPSTSGDINPKTLIFLKYLKYGLDIRFPTSFRTGGSCPFLHTEYYQLFQWQVKKDDATYSETPVEISGSEDQIKKAKEMIEQIIGPDSSVTNNMGGMTSSQYH